MKTGKISYEVDANDRRVIDVSELDRAFGLMPQAGERTEAVTVQAEIEKAAQALEAERMKMRIRMLQEQLDVANQHVEDIKAQRDQWQKQAQQVLLTSQYSQKQAEEYKEKLDQRDRMAMERRQQMMEQKQRQATQGGAGRPSQTNENRKTGPIEQQRQGRSGFWNKLRGQPAAADEKTSGQPKQAGSNEAA
jgi:hypothetical protein